LAGVSLMGLPPSSGFLAKWLLIEAALIQEQWHLVAVVLSGGLLAALYVFKVIRQAFLAPPEDVHLAPVPRNPEWLALALSAARILLGLRAVELRAQLATGEVGGPSPNRFAGWGCALPSTCLPQWSSWPWWECCWPALRPAANSG